MNKFTFRKTCVALFVGQAIAAGSAQGASIVVNSSDDLSVDSDGVCTLREAVLSANTDPSGGTSGCADGSGTDTITFESGISTVTLSQPSAMSVASDILIDGGALGVVIDGDSLTRVFDAQTSSSLDITMATIQNGRSTDGGAAIRADGAVIVLDKVLLDNNVDTMTNDNTSIGGGAIFANNDSNITIDDSTLSNNQTSRNGGAIFAFDGSSITLTNSTLDGNIGRAAGGMMLRNASSATVTNSTVSGNIASSSVAGGLWSNFSSSLSLINSTVTGNEALLSYGGGIGLNDSSDLSAVNSIIAGNSASSGSEIGINSSFTRVKLVANNVIGVSSIDTDQAIGSVTPGASDIIATSDGFVGSINMPKTLIEIIAALASNGGPTQTHALAEDSIAINSGRSLDCPVMDQRGEVRDEECDIGAFEAPPQLDEDMCVPVKTENGKLAIVCL